MFTITVGRIGKRSRKTGTLAHREVTIGRGSENDLILEDGIVSRTHCRLVALEGGVLVMDEGSTNGTWLNGRPVDGPSLLTFDDELVIGPYTLRVQSLVGRCTTGQVRERRDPHRATPGARPTGSSVPRAHEYWEVLGVRPGTSLDEVRAAWRRLVAQYHPDKVAHLGPELQELAERKPRELNMAWEYVSRQQV